MPTRALIGLPKHPSEFHIVLLEWNRDSEKSASLFSESRMQYLNFLEAKHTFSNAKQVFIAHPILEAPIRSYALNVVNRNRLYLKGQMCICQSDERNK